MTHCRSLLAISLLLLSHFGMQTLADAPQAEALDAEVLTPEQSSAALKFVKEHHPQLNSLLGRLKQRTPADFQKALVEVSRTCERLQRLQSRDLPRYEVELNLWKVDSRIRLLAARMANDQRPALEKQLRSQLDRRTDLKLQQLTLDRERLTARIEKVNAQIQQISADRPSMIDKEVDRLQRSVRSRSANVTRKRAAQTENRPDSDDQPDKPKSDTRPASKKSADKQTTNP